MFSERESMFSPKMFLCDCAVLQTLNGLTFAFANIVGCMCTSKKIIFINRNWHFGVSRELLGLCHAKKTRIFKRKMQ